MQAASLKLKIGPYDIKPVPTGLFALDGGAMFGTVPKVLWEKTNPADDKNRIAMEARALLLSSPNRKVLIDVGNGADFVDKYGPKLGAKFAEIYGVQGAGTNGVVDSLARLKVQTEDITDVILTHLHFDHAGGGTCSRDGKLVPTFQKAQYYVQSDNLATARAPNMREKASYLSANFEPLEQAGVLKQLDGDVDQLIEGISLRVVFGHTRAQQLPQVTDGKTTLVYCGDLIPTSSHVRLPFVMGYDLDPLKVIDEKRELLTEAAKNGWYLFFEHDPFCDVALIEASGEDFKVKQTYQLI